MRRDTHLAACGGEAQGVADQVRQGLFEAAGVGVNGEARLHERQRDAGVMRGRAEPVAQARPRRQDRLCLLAQPLPARFHLREVQQVPDQVFEAYRFVVHHAEVPGPVGVADRQVGHAQGLDVAPDRRQRRVQFVRDVGQQLAPHVLLRGRAPDLRGQGVGGLVEGP